jgi:opacity protein-like surface antigen
LKRSLFAVALSGMALVSLPFAARAQVSTVAKAVEFGVAAGGALPMSNLSDFYQSGFNGTVTIGFHPQMIPLGIRVDGAYNQFSAKTGTIGGSVHFASVTGNLEYSIPSEIVTPYLIGGAGFYNAPIVISAFGSSGTNNKFGWNLGGGIKMPLSGFDTFLEARYNQVQGNGVSFKFIPITFGVMF